MKKFIKLTFLLIACMFISMEAIQAQKIGTLNAQALLFEMPEVKAMDAEVEALATQLQKQGQNKVADYKAKEERAVQQKKRGELSPKEEEALLAELQKDQEAILALEKEMEQKIISKRNELLEPVYAKINTAIQAVAEENGYLYIMDASVVSYSDNTNDVTSLVKTKLGL